MSEDRTLLLLSSLGTRAYTWHHGVLTFVREFFENETDLRSFADYLHARKKSVFRILADVPDEHFQKDTIPPAKGADRRALIARRLAQNFPSSPYAAAISLGHAPGGRGDERLLLASLNRPHVLAPWLQRIEAAGSWVETVTLPALLLNRIGPPTSGRQGSYLLYTLGQGGLRQTCFEDGDLLFSRLTGHRVLDAKEAIVACQEESQRVRHYWNGGTAFAGTRKSYLLLAGDEAEEGLKYASAYDGLHVIDLHPLEAAHGVPHAPDKTSRCDNFLLHLLAKGPSAPDLAPSELRATLLAHRWQRRIWRSAFTISLIFAAIAAAQWAKGYGLTKTTEHLRSQTLAMREQRQMRLDAQPPLPASPETLYALDQTLRQVAGQTATPQPLLYQISQILEQAPGLELERIDWRLIPAKGPEKEPSGHADNESQEQTMTTVAVLHLRSSNPADGEAPGEALVAALQAHPGIRADVIPSAPGPSAEDGPSPSTHGRFSIRIVASSSAP